MDVCLNSFYIKYVFCQLSALLRPTDNPWQPNLWHNLHPAQWAHQDWLRSAPSWASSDTATRLFHLTKHNKHAWLLFPQCGTGCLLMVRCPGVSIVNSPSVCYLHTDRVFLSVFPDASVHSKGRQHRDEQRNLHFFAPEYGGESAEWSLFLHFNGLISLKFSWFINIILLLKIGNISWLPILASIDIVKFWRNMGVWEDIFLNIIVSSTHPFIRLSSCPTLIHPSQQRCKTNSIMQRVITRTRLQKNVFLEVVCVFSTELELFCKNDIHLSQSGQIFILI